LALTTTDTLLYAARTFDAVAGYRELLDSLAQTRQPGVTGGIANFEHALRQRGIHLRDDVLAKLGPEAALLAQWRAGARFPDFAVVLQRTGDRAALDTALDTLRVTMASGENEMPWDESTFQDAPLRTLRFGTDFITPTYAVAEQFLIVASSPDFTRNLLRQLRQPQPTLAAHPQYQTAMARLPGGGWSYAYADLPVLVTRLHGLLNFYAAQLPANDYFDLAKLPPADAWAKHLSPYVATSVTGARHELATSYSPVSVPSFLVAGGGIGAAVAYGVNAVAPTTSSDTDAPPLRRGNQRAPSQSPVPQ
jgi:hypothetical protein